MLKRFFLILFDTPINFTFHPLSNSFYYLRPDIIFLCGRVALRTKEETAHLTSMVDVVVLLTRVMPKLYTIDANKSNDFQDSVTHKKKKSLSDFLDWNCILKKKKSQMFD